MKTVREILQKKDTDVWSVLPETTVFDTLRLMAEKDIGAVLVLESDQLVGIFSERDYARKVILLGKSSKETLVKEIMTPTVEVVRPGQSMEECMALMTDKRLRHLPVIDKNKLAGIISIGDVVQTIISEQNFLIDQLENYVRRSLS